MTLQGNQSILLHFRIVGWKFIYFDYTQILQYNFETTRMKPIFVTLIGFLLIAQAMSGAYMDLLLSLPDAMLFNLAVQQKVGQCYISSCPITTTSCACDLYAKVKLTATTSIGLPDLIGTGCVYAPDYPRHMSICFGPPNTYPNYNATPTPICTSSGVKNAANMIRIGIKKGHCKIPTC